MSYLIDSDRIVNALKGRADAASDLARLFAAGLAISTITFGEVYEGIYYGSDPARYQAVFRQFLRGVRLLPVTRAIATEFAILRGELRQQGQLIPEADLLIAATAIRHRLTLVTRNTRHFARISRLQLHSVT